MTSGNIRNAAASVHQRLLNKAKESSRPFNELLQHFAIERFIYRLSISPHADRFILKGALMFSVWGGPVSRTTKDMDFLGRIDNDLETIATVMKSICELAVEPGDGLTFDQGTLTVERIADDAEYKGVRVHVPGNLGNARIALQIDVGFGDEIVPGPCKIEFPTLLDFPAPKLNGYTMESTISEKFHAMVKLGILNSRMKDFYDIWLLSRSFEFHGVRLSDAIVNTFKVRQTPVTANPSVFDSSFIDDAGKQAQWRGFIVKTKLTAAPEKFENVIIDIKKFLGPALTAISECQTFHAIWNPPGPWK